MQIFFIAVSAVYAGTIYLKKQENKDNIKNNVHDSVFKNNGVSAHYYKDKFF